ncbi:GntR family transcriptional regulator [Tropicimonas marinistellae]|uniref:GntR family transcriptional regulator n=1 Tax=Tropicimonas marinistellae TaxID=1739787 RepID=UPI000829C64E|nr:GntR family transcriptional regulator [Tropicimonas marinistellae]
MPVADFLSPKGWMNAADGPRYVCLRRRIEEGIDLGIFPPDAPLPPEREIANLTGLSRVTVRKAIRLLTEKGVVIQRQGSGSFVTDAHSRSDETLARLTSFTDEMTRRGLETQTTWLEQGIFVPSPEEVVALALAPSDNVARLSRLRLAGGRPMAIERAALPVDILPDPESVAHSLYDLLERRGQRPVRALQKISAVNLDAEAAALLELTPNVAALTTERRSFLESGRVAEFTRSTYRGDAYELVVELRLASRQE